MWTPSGQSVAELTGLLWDSASAALDTRLTAQAAPVTAAAFDPSGARLATADSDGIGYLWPAPSPS